MKYCIALPSVSGKTTLSNKYKELYDIDKLLSKEERDLLKKQYTISHDNDNWDTYLYLEYQFLNKKIKDL